MSAIDAVFRQLRSAGRKALMPFVTAGDPDLDFTRESSAGWPRGVAACASWAFLIAIRSPTGR